MPKKISSVLLALTEHLQRDLGGIDPRIKNVLQVKPMRSEELLKQANQNLQIVSSLSRMSLSDNILSLRLLTVLPYTTPTQDGAGLVAVDIVSALIASLKSFGTGKVPGLLGPPENISAENLSLPQRAISLWGLSYTLELRDSAVLAEGAEIGQILDIADLKAFLEAGGSGPLIQEEIQIRS